MPESFDIAVVGAGPAGTSAAIAAARHGHRVLLLERGAFPRHKVCGEFVSHEALRLLHEICPAASLENALAISRAPIFLGDKLRTVAIKPPANSITRFVMDSSLWEAAKKSGVSAIEYATVQELAGDGPFRIVTGATEFIARAVINASGRWSSLNEHMRLPKLGAGVGLKRHFRETNPAPSVDLYFFPGGYCGVQPISDDDSINVSAMVLPTVAKDLDSVFRLHPKLHERSRNWTPLTDLFSTYPLVHAKPLPVQEKRNILNVGDAAAFIDPFVGDGISMALHSGKLATEALSAFLNGKCPLHDAARLYHDRYAESLLPAFVNAERLRKMIASPTLRNLAMELFRVPGVSRLALRATRARTSE